MSDIDQQFIEYVVKSLVGKPEAVHIDRRIDEKGVLLELTVDPEDLGRVIGKRGATAQSLRTLLRALGTKNDARYNLKIIDNGDPDHVRRSDSSNNQTDSGSSSQPDQEAASDQQEHNTSEQSPEHKIEQQLETGNVHTPDSEAKKTAHPSDEDQTSDRLKKARAELADLDD
ncbi:MAG: hypothetical protein NVS1B10_01950 [Candidatus Saccharimonadales bacterium]